MKSSSNSTVTDGLIQIGTIIGAHGIGGAIRVYSYAESADRYAPGSQLTVITATNETKHYRVIKAQLHKKVFRLWLKGITTRPQAEALVEAGVYCNKKDLPPLEPDTYYWLDLLGMAVYDVENHLLGEVVQIIPTGANDVYVVKCKGAHPAEEILIPAIASVVLEVDTENKQMRVDLPEGLL